MMTQKTNWPKEVWNFAVWFAIGWICVNIGEWMFPSLPPSTIKAFFLGGFLAVIALSLYGGWLQGKAEVQRQLAMNQFIEDQKADVEKQAKIDKEIINKLKHEHELSGQEQDKRLRALEAALKHLRGK